MVQNIRDLWSGWIGNKRGRRTYAANILPSITGTVFHLDCSILYHVLPVHVEKDVLASALSLRANRRGAVYRERAQQPAQLSSVC